MKKKILALSLSLVMAFGFSACGNQPATGSSSISDKQESSDTRESSQTQESSQAEGSMTLTDWYNSENRTALEDTLNNMFASSGMTFSVTVEEPDTMVYNYQYTEQLDLNGASQEDIDATYSASLDAAVATVISDINTYRDTYDLPLTTIRMTYLNADGSLIYSQDITEDYQSPSNDSEADASQAPAETYATLQDWMESEEADLTIETTNKILESSGMTIDLSADGNIFVYEYYVSDDLGLSSLTEDQLATAFSPMVEAQQSSIETLFSNFETAYGLTLGGVRFSFYSEEGTLLYSVDIANE